MSFKYLSYAETDSGVSRALSKAGYKVAHLDTNSFYGGNEASLSFDELIQWADANSSSIDSPFSLITYSTKMLPQSRQYSICLRPSIFPSMGPLVSSLISSGVSKYSEFRLLDCVSVYHPSGVVKNVPASKEDVFKSSEITLIGKRRLMRFLTFAAGDFETQKEIQGQHDKPFLEFLKTAFSLSDDIAGVIAYALAYCVTEAGKCRYYFSLTFKSTAATRPNSPCTAEATQISALYWTVRSIRISCWALWWHWRHCSRILPRCCSPWSDLYPWPKDRVDHPI